jgi:hypothetical protein
MATKQFKIGESAVGGIIKVTTSANFVSVECLDYYSKKEVCSKDFHMSDLKGSTWPLDLYLSEKSTSYWADKIVNWVKEKAKL